MSKKLKIPSGGYIAFVLHSHLPYVVNHGTWPHGLDWLHEAAAETYLPLLRTLGSLEERGVQLKASINLSPILLEQLAHPTFQESFVEYLEQKIEASRRDAAEFVRKGDRHFVYLANFWERFFTQAQGDFEALGRDIVGGFRRFYESGAIEIITCAATHGYLPLLGTDASIRAQVRLGVATHERFFGRKPRGIWLPECGYRPAGQWNFPVPVDGAGGAHGPFARSGVEQILGECGIEYFFVDTHMVETTARFTPYELMAGDVPIAAELEPGEAHASFYLPYFAGAPNRKRSRVAFFTRDPRTGIQVWSGEHGYPGDSAYLDFHKKHWPGGHRYWQVTLPKSDLGSKTAYYPETASERTREHASHFTALAQSVLRYNAPNGAVPPVLTAPFDAELFGHWWFEGPQWLENVALECGKADSGLQAITCGEYLDRHHPAGFVTLPEGSWGRNGSHEVWLNPETAWTWEQIYPAERAVEEMAEGGRWRGNQLATRLATQICRELLLLESSDWQFLITTQHARDYAEKRFDTHLRQFHTLLEAWRRYEATLEIAPESVKALGEIEQRDSVFPELTPDVYAP